MIVYSDTINQFNKDVDAGIIAEIIKEEFEKHGINHNNEAEYRSWDNSLFYMSNILYKSNIDKDVHVAIEYKIPTTSKRVDFLISGKDDNDKKNLVIIELKQWEKAKRTDKEDLVLTYVGGGNRLVTHPSYQAYSYAKTIESFSEYVQEEKIKIYPCSYLHNYEESERKELENPLYDKIVKVSPLFLKKDSQKLRNFIERHIKKSDQGKLLYEIDHGKIRPSKALQDTLSSMLDGNEEYYMLDEQKVVYSSIKKIVEESRFSNEKHTIIVQGGPGTGKSVLAINLLVDFRDLTVSYVTKNAAPRDVYFAKLKRGRHKYQYVKTLFRSSGSFVNSKNNDFDCLLIDEAHRLNEKSGFFGNIGENQIKELIKASKVSVFFIDEDQRVTLKDIGSIDAIKKHAKNLGSTIHMGEDFILTSQYRCNGSEGYIAFIDDLLGLRETANKDYFDLDYDIKVYDDLVLMREDLRKKNHNNKARMLAGYCYDWITRKNPKGDIYDIVINDFKAKWNFDNTNTWAIDETSFDQVGCIHTSQGLEFDYVGVIIGNDLRYENKRVITDYTKRSKNDASLKGIHKHNRYKDADIIIRNTYKTLLTRGQKGCYIYCEDKNLSEHIKKRIKLLNEVRANERNYRKNS